MGHAIWPIGTARIVSLVITAALLVLLGIGRARVAPTAVLRTVIETVGVAAAAALEVAFIVITFGAAAGQMPSAIVGAAAAVVLTVAVCVVVKGPLSRVPENWIKFMVGLLLTSFGTFWAAEGAGVSWPGSDLAILGLLAVYSLASWVYVRFLRGSHAAEQAAAA